MVFGFGGSGTFTSAKDIPSLKGKVILVTGCTSGLGKQSALEFARHEPAQVWLTARDAERGKQTINSIKKELPDAPLKLLVLDLTSLTSVRDAAKQFLAEASRLDILMLNAGIMMTDPGLTQDGYELQFGTNHLGHALLAKLLLPTLLKTAESPGADVHITVLTSASAYQGPPPGGIVFDKLRAKCDDMSAFNRYAQSKLSNALFTREMAKRYPQLTTACCHPGAVLTNLGRPVMNRYPFLWIVSPLAYLFCEGLESGVKNQLWVSVSNDVVSGEYYMPIGKPTTETGYLRDDELAERLWDWTDAELEGYKL